MIDFVRRLTPGILLCLAITAAAVVLQAVETDLAGAPYLEALVLAILLGVAVRTAWKPGPLWQPGIQFSAKFVLECAIVVVVYRLLLSWEGDLFQAREQKILEIVTNRAT